MKPSLVFISPEWIPELDELLQITKNSFQIKVLTQKQNIELVDPYIEILQCFETYSPLELAKLLPWMLQLSAPQFHVLLPENSNPKQLAGIGTIITMARALPQSVITHSPWLQKGWGFHFWKKAFQNLFDTTIETKGQRFLSLPTEKKMENFALQNKNVDFYTCTWIFPVQSLDDLEWKSFIHHLATVKTNRLEFWNWESLSIRHKNKVRDLYAPVWSQFQFCAPRTNFDDWNSIKFLVLINIKQHQFSESDLLDLAILHKVNIIMDIEMRNRLEGPWKEKDTFWLWHPHFLASEDHPWNNSQQQLSFNSINELRVFRDEQSNQILRKFIKKT